MGDFRSAARKMSRAPDRRARYMVGISSRCPEMYLRWLMDLLRSQYSDLGLALKYLPITNNNSRQWRAEVKACSHGILYHSLKHGRINITDVNGEMYTEELLYLSQHLGWDKVLVVLDDLTLTGEDEKQLILKSQPSLQQFSSQLLLIPENRKSNVIYSKDAEIRHFLAGENWIRSQEQLGKLMTRPRSRPSENQDSLFGSDEGSRQAPVLESPYNPKLGMRSRQVYQPEVHTYYNLGMDPYQSKSHVSFNSMAKKPLYPQKRQKICLFSRSAEKNYQWLVNRLQTEFATDVKLSLRTVRISNKYMEFTKELVQCTFAILYHTQKDGRLNVTDVTDSLYDRELEDMSVHLGRNNVIVIIDDLAEGSLEERRRIVNAQPSITRWAQELFLFTEKEKEGTCYYFTNMSESEILQKKLQRIIDMIKDGEKMQSNGINYSQRSPVSPERELDEPQTRDAREALPSAYMRKDNPKGLHGHPNTIREDPSLPSLLNSPKLCGSSCKSPFQSHIGESIKKPRVLKGQAEAPQNSALTKKKERLVTTSDKTQRTHLYHPTHHDKGSNKAKPDEGRTFSSPGRKTPIRTKTPQAGNKPVQRLKTECSEQSTTDRQLRFQYLGLMENLLQEQQKLITNYYNSHCSTHNKLFQAWEQIKQIIIDQQDKLQEYQMIIENQKVTIRQLKGFNV